MKILLLSALALAAPLSETWKGQVEIPGMPLDFTAELQTVSNGWIGTIDIPMQAIEGMPLADVASTATAVTFSPLPFLETYVNLAIV